MLSTRAKKFWSLLLPSVLLLAGLYLVPIRIFETDFSQVPGDLGDARFNNYILEHGHKFLGGQVKDYWDAPFMYPYSNVIAFSDNLLGSLPVYSAFRVSGYDRETSFQLWLLSLFILNFICCYWVLTRWTSHVVLSATGAYIFAFSILLVGNIYNVQTYPRFIVPFVFYWSWKYLSVKQWKYFLFMLLGIVYQFYCGIYLGFFLLYAVLFLFISYVLIYKDVFLFTQFKKIKTATCHLGIILLAGILLAPLMQPYMEISGKLGMRQFQDVFPSIPTLTSYFFTSPAPVVWKFLSEHGKSLPFWWCHFLFVGALPWLGIIAIPAILLSRKTNPGKKKFIALIALGFLFSFLFSLNINGFTLYKIIYQLPGFASMRGVNRVINIEIMLFVLVFVFVFYELADRNRYCKWLVYIFPLLVIIDNAINPREIMRYNKEESRKQIESVKEKIKEEYDQKHAAIAYVPLFSSGQEIAFHLNVMLAAQELNVPCVNAYTGSYPNHYPFYRFFDEETLTKWCEVNQADKNNIQQIRGNAINLGKNIESSKSIHLRAINNKYVCADETVGNLLIANRDNASGWETFLLLGFEKDRYAFMAHNNKFLSAELDSQNEITATRDNINEWETFTLFRLDSNYVAFKAANDKYLSVDEKTFQLFARGDSIGEKERFVLITRK